MVITNSWLSQVFFVGNKLLKNTMLQQIQQTAERLDNSKFIESCTLYVMENNLHSVESTIQIEQKGVLPKLSGEATAETAKYDSH